MRRDLALARERDGQESQNPVIGSAEDIATATSATQSEGAATEASEAGDVVMEDPKPTVDEQPQEAARLSPQSIGKPHGEVIADPATESNVVPTAQMTSDKTPEGREPEHPKSSLNTDTQDSSPPPQAGEPSIIDTNQNDDKLPDAGTSNNNADLDSLFNDPVSASDTAADDPAIDFGLPTTDSTNDFDFGSFNTSMDNPTANGNDDLNNLLPGLSEYANTQPAGAGGEVDFDALFAAATANTGGQGGKSAEEQGSAQQRDTTFDDLMDFGNFTDAGVQGGEGDNQDFDLSFD